MQSQFCNVFSFIKMLLYSLPSHPFQHLLEALQEHVGMGGLEDQCRAEPDAHITTPTQMETYSQRNIKQTTNSNTDRNTVPLFLLAATIASLVATSGQSTAQNVPAPRAFLIRPG